MVAELSTLGVWYNVLYNAAGVIAIILVVIAFQCKIRERVILFHLLSSVCWMTYYFLQGEFTAAAMNVVIVIRELVFMQREKHAWAHSIFWLFFFLALLITLTALTFSTWKDIFPLLGTTLSTIAFFVINVKLLKALCAGNSCFWLTNNLLKGTYLGAVSDTLAIISILIWFIRTRKPPIDKENNEKTPS